MNCHETNPSGRKEPYLVTNQESLSRLSLGADGRIVLVCATTVKRPLIMTGPYQKIHVSLSHAIVNCFWFGFAILL